MYKGLTLLAVVLVLLAGVGPSSSNKRAYVAGKYALELDGLVAGFLESVEGGNARGEVVEEVVGGIVKKHIANVKYEDITVTCGAEMSKAFYDWIAQSFSGKAVRKNGAIIAADFDYKETSRRVFSNALISEVGFPALDAASKDAAKMTIKMSPEITRYIQGSGDSLKPTVQKKWLPSNFKLEIQGLDCSRVNKIEALTIKQKVAELEPGKIEYPNLTIMLPEAFSPTIYAWYEDFVINGKNSDAEEKSGTLIYLAPTRDPLFTLTFKNLGIFKLSPDRSEAGDERLRRVKAEMYCESLELKYGGTVLE